MEELRGKYKSGLQTAAHHIALECIHPQSVHGSPYHVHPYPSPVRLQHAFGSQQSPKMFHPKGLKTHLDGVAHQTPNESPILGRALCLTPRGSPVPGRVSHLNDKFQDSLTLTSDTDALVAKISAMFPTVSETHIKILLKKYYNREAVVISALQVEKHPITTPGPLSMSPCASRLQRSAVGVYSALALAKGSTHGSSHFTPLTGTPHVVISALQVEKHPITTPGPLSMSPCASRLQRSAVGVYSALALAKGSTHGSSHFTPLTGTPHGSPMLLRPASCASSYYGTNRSSDGQPARHQSPKMKLKYMKSIFPKAEETLILDVLANKDNNVQKASEELIGMGFAKKETVMEKPRKEKETPQPPKKVVTIMKTLEEKNELKRKLQKKYSSVAERVVGIALESVGFNEERAEQILNAVLQEESPKKAKVEVKETKRPSLTDAKKGPILKSSVAAEARYKSQMAGGAAGPNAALRQGPKDSLLLEDYITWNGPNPDLRTGQAVTPTGPEPRDKALFHARGPQGLAKGPSGLAKGSIFQKLNKKSAKIVA